MEMASRARTGKIALDELQGSTFTITNLGGIGGTSFTPIVNWPEVAILGLSRSYRKPVWKDDGFDPRLTMPLSLSYDHRLIDGADAARFLRWLAQALEDPFVLSLEG
jgi:pyruvate dehydrogenase E2 component (dihydrolipoamide acetyltransferase)